jgi:cysteine desulfurase
MRGTTASWPKIYLDYNATTPIDPRVSVAMLPWLAERFGNPSSRDHSWGWDADKALENSRSDVAECINAHTSEIVFTSGATEALNIAIRGFVGYHEWCDKKIVTASTEHQAVLTPCRQLAELTGVEVQVLAVDRYGNLDLPQLEGAVRSNKRVLVVIMQTNNEIGTIHPIKRIAEIARNAHALFLCDMAQAVGKVSVDVHADDIDMAAFSAHKVNGPKGVGLLFIRNRNAPIPLEPLISGGGQENGMRGGTPNVPGIVGIGEAFGIARGEWKSEAARVTFLRDRLEQCLLTALPGIWINGDRDNRVPNTSNIGFRGVDARILIRDMHDIAVSTRAACSSGLSGPSHVLKALGLTDDEAYSSIRFSLGRFTTEEEIDYTIEKVIASVRKLRLATSATGSR